MAKKASVQTWKKASAALVLLVAVLCAVNAGLTYWVVQLSKDTKIEGNLMLAKDSNDVVQTGIAKRTIRVPSSASGALAGALDDGVLSKLTHLNVQSSNGSVTGFQVSGYNVLTNELGWRTGVELVGVNGEKFLIPAAIPEAAAAGAAPAAAGRRGLQSNHWEARCNQQNVGNFLTCLSNHYGSGVGAAADAREVYSFIFDEDSAVNHLSVQSNVFGAAGLEDPFENLGGRDEYFTMVRKVAYNAHRALGLQYQEDYLVSNKYNSAEMALSKPSAVSISNEGWWVWNAITGGSGALNRIHREYKATTSRVKEILDCGTERVRPPGALCYKKAGYIWKLSPGSGSYLDFFFTYLGASSNTYGGVASSFFTTNAGNEVYKSAWSLTAGGSDIASASPPASEFGLGLLAMMLQSRYVGMGALRCRTLHRAEETYVVSTPRVSGS